MDKNKAELKYYIDAYDCMEAEEYRVSQVYHKKCSNIAAIIMRIEYEIAAYERWIAGILKLCRTGK